MYVIIAFGTFGKCYVEDELNAGPSKDKAKRFDSLEEAVQWQAKHWPANEVTTRIIELP